MKRRLLIVIAALALAACSRRVVLDPAPDSPRGIPDASFADVGDDGSFGNDGGGNDGGGIQDAGTIGDAAHD